MHGDALGALSWSVCKVSNLLACIVTCEKWIGTISTAGIASRTVVLFVRVYFE